MSLVNFIFEKKWLSVLIIFSVILGVIHFLMGTILVMPVLLLLVPIVIFNLISKRYYFLTVVLLILCFPFLFMNVNSNVGSIGVPEVYYFFVVQFYALFLFLFNFNYFCKLKTKIKNKILKIFFIIFINIISFICLYLMNFIFGMMISGGWWNKIIKFLVELKTF